MLKLIIGRAGSGKTARIMREIKGRAECGKNSYLIVPEQYSHDAEKILCKVCGNSVCLSAQVLSFSRLGSRVFAQTGRLCLKTLDAGGRVLLMHLALTSVQEKLSVFSFSRMRTDFLSGLLEIYDELKTSAVGTVALLEAADRVEGSLSDKLRDLALIFTAYDALRPEGYLDPKEKLDLLAEDIGEVGFADNAALFVDGFTDFTQQEMNVLEGILRRNPDLTVCLTGSSLDSEETAFELTRKTASRLLAMAKSHGIESTLEITEPEEGSRSAELRFVEENLFDHGAAQFPHENHAVDLFAASGIVAECEGAASRILTLVRWYGYRFRDIAVVSHDWEKYDSAAENTFEKYGIPTMSGEKSDILSKPVPALILYALDAICSDWEAKNVFAYLKTGLTNLVPDEIDELENYVLRWSIRGEKIWTREDGFSFDPDGFVQEGKEKHSEALRRINDARRKASGPLGFLSEKLKKADTALEKAAGLYAFLEKLELRQRLSEKSDLLRRLGRTQEAEEYEKLWDILVTALDEAAAILGDKILETDEFAALLKILLSKFEIGTIPSAIDRVAIGGLLRVRKRGVKCLFVLGASDDSLPKYTASEGMLSDDDRLTLGQVGIELSEAPESRISREMASIYATFTMPSDRLCVSYQDGLCPSFAVLRMGKMFSVSPKTDTPDIKACSLLPCFELALSDTREEWAISALEYFRRSGVMAERLAAVERASKLPRGRLSKISAEKLYSCEINTTASRVDKFHSCKFAYFLQYGLGAKPRKKAEMNPSEIGNFLHYILENVTRDVSSLGGFKTVSEDKIAEVTEIYTKRYVSEVLGDFSDKSDRFRYLFNRLCRDACTILADMAAELRVSEFTPIDFELDFSPQGDLPPIAMADDEVSVKVNGRVDRVDGWIHDGKLYLRVVDYKTGEKEFSLSDVVDGLGMQMLIYLFALADEGRDYYHKEIVPAGVMYMPARQIILSEKTNLSDEKVAAGLAKARRRSGLLLSDEAVIRAMEDSDAPQYIPVKFKKGGEMDTSDVATAAEFGKLKKHIEKTLLEMGREIRGGSITADPYFRTDRDNACLHCDFFEACHFDEKCGDRQRRLRSLKSPEAWEKIDWEVQRG